MALRRLGGAAVNEGEGRKEGMQVGPQNSKILYKLLLLSVNYY